MESIDHVKIHLFYSMRFIPSNRLIFFSAGIKKYQTVGWNEPHRVKKMYFYMINGFHKPDFTIDITQMIEKKLAALRAYRSQFELTAQSVQTPLVNDYI